MEETLVKTPNNKPSSDQVYVETFDDELICESEFEGENASSMNVPMKWTILSQQSGQDARCEHLNT